MDPGLRSRVARMAGGITGDANLRRPEHDHSMPFRWKICRNVSQPGKKNGHNWLAYIDV